MKISSLKPGQVLYAVHTLRMGNTTVTTKAVFPVVIDKVEEDGASFTASWNMNPKTRYYRVPANWRKAKPFLVESRTMGYLRLATRVEQRDAIAENRVQARLTYLKIVPRAERPTSNA